ncbi:MAG TPA: biotin--[acetyl-CoA-carboxylase] ligase [Jiangellaceae bacterium]
MWRIHRVDSTGSTNVDVASIAISGEPEGYVLVADQQTRGKGRLGRSWESPPGSSLSVSVLLRPVDVPAGQWPWLPLLVGVAAVEAVREAAARDAHLKWPNDVLLDDAKLAGILVERIDSPDGPAAVAGIGMNITSTPAAGAASLDGTGATRDDVLEALLGRIADWYRRWRADPDGCGLAPTYREMCSTLGNEVRAELPNGSMIVGRAADVDASGGLIIAGDSGREVVSAGDVVHVRPT